MAPPTRPTYHRITRVLCWSSIITGVLVMFLFAYARSPLFSLLGAANIALGFTRLTRLDEYP
jgi:hypothetical protein